MKVSVFRVFTSFNAKVDPEKEHAFRLKLKEYQRKLITPDGVLPDPFSLKDITWFSEEQSIKMWPSIYLTDISDYLRLKSPYALCHRLINEYKQEKAFL